MSLQESRDQKNRSNKLKTRWGSEHEYHLPAHMYSSAFLVFYVGFLYLLSTLKNSLFLTPLDKLEGLIILGSHSLRATVGQGCC